MYKILFVCSANIFRSRFAEEVFNSLTQSSKISAQAFSAGLKVGEYHIRKIYRPAMDQLKHLNITPKRPDELSVHINDINLQDYDRFICMDENEHRPMVESNPLVQNIDFEYWNIIDEPKVESDVSLPICYNNVKELILDLNGELQDQA